MKLKSISLLLITASCLFGVTETTVDWTKVSVSQKDNGQIRFLSGKKPIGFVKDSKKKNLGKAEIQNGFLILDTTGYKDSGTYAMIVLNTKKYSDQTVQVEFDLAGSEDGTKVDFYFTGRLSDKKHYWKRHVLTVTQNIQHIVLKQQLPYNLEFLQMRVDFPSPGIYKLGNIKYGTAVQEKVDGSINHIPNGGAERGFYCVIPPSQKRFAGLMKVSLDSNVKHSGRYSFRLDAQKADYNRIVFNSVPYVIGKPASFSAWMRAEKPTTVDLMMFAMSGGAYAKKFKVGKEWKKYTFTIPNYGSAKKIPGIRTVGTPTNRPGYINPVITLPSQKNTVWIDDLAFQLNTETTEPPPPPVYISGRLDEPRGYYRQGTPITANMKFEPSGTMKTAELEYELVNWRGEKIIPTQREQISLPMEKSFTFKVPEHLQGPMNLKFRVIAGKEVMTHNFYCGVISQDTVFNKRVGINMDTRNRESAQVTVDLLKDFGIGSVRIWANHPWSRNLDIFRKNDFYVMLCLSVPHTRKIPKKHRLFFPLDYTEYFEFLKEEIEKYYKNNVDIYEIFNEPNIWYGRSKNPDPSKYCAATPDVVVDGTIKIADFLKECDPGVPLAGPACCGTNVNYLSSYLNAGADKAVQVVTEHPYRFLPEQPDYEPNLKALQEVVKGKEIQATESGSQTFGSWPNNEILPQAITRAARDIRLMIIGLANGVRRFYQFRAGNEVQNSWQIFIGSGPEENNSWQPGIWCYAARNLASLIGEKSEASSLKLGFDYRCYIFDNGNERVAALWKWFGKPAGLVFDRPVSYLDMMGTPFTARNIWLDDCPIYIRTKQSVADLSGMIRNALPDSSEDAPVKITADPSDAEIFTVNLTNLTIRKLSGEVRLSTGETKKFSGLDGEAVLKLPFRAPKRITTVPQKLEATVTIGKHVLKQEIQLKAILVPQTAKKIVIDGDLSDWKQYTSIKLDSKNAVKLVPWNKDALRTKAEVRVSWDQEFLYLAVIADKKGFFPDKDVAPWKGDGVQVAFDTMRNADHTTIKYQDDDFEYSIWERNGRPAVFRHYASIEAYDSLNKSIGLTNDVTVVIKNQGDRTVYEMAFSPVSISPFKLFAGSACRFNLILNMSDGKQRIGWLEIAPGLGKNPKKPGIFPDLILVK